MRMNDEVERIYSTLVTRIQRDPRRVTAEELPLLIGAADLPVYKSDRSSAPLVTCNGGLHCHLLLLIPPVSRLKESIQDHFASKQDLYRGSQNLIQRIHVEKVTETPERVVDYVFKTIARNRLSYDESILIFPRASSELGRVLINLRRCPLRAFAQLQQMTRWPGSAHGEMETITQVDSTKCEFNPRAGTAFRLPA
jgi:hypothetical protein